LAGFEGGFAGILLALSVALVFFAFFGRELVGFSVSWSDEVARYLLVWITYIGAAAVTREGGNIRVEYFSDLLPPRPKHLLAILVDVLSLAFTTAVFVFSVQYVYGNWQIGLMTAESDLFVPKWIVLAGVPLGFLLMSIRLALRIYEAIRYGTIKA
jgi:TRAP-type C4-dicarboxylate transport system permease small subunit